jgi:hypothetical protein
LYYYQFHVTGYFALTPDFQMNINPTLNSNTDVIYYLGIRGRISI